MRRKYIVYQYLTILLLIVVVERIFHYWQNSCPPCRTIPLTNQRLGSYKIPNIVHFIIGQGDSSESILDRVGPRLGQRRMERAPPEFQLINYLVLLAARRQIQPDQIIVHFSHEPIGDWWLRAKQDKQLNLTLRKIPLTISIFQHHLYHHAHRTDIARLQVLDQFGGIYLDFDVLSLRSFDSLLENQRNVEAILAWESEQYRTVGNSVVLAPRSSIFLQRAYQSYQSFNSSCWACHSVVLLGQLAQIYSNEVLILPTNTFLTPSWSQIEELYIFNKFDFRKNYACHLWNSLVGKIFLYNLTLDSFIKPRHTATFHRMVIHAVGKSKLEQLARSSS